MEAEIPFLSVEELDALTPDQRLAAFRARIITDQGAISDEFRDRIHQTGRRLAEERRMRQ